MTSERRRAAMARRRQAAPAEAAGPTFDSALSERVGDRLEDLGDNAPRLPAWQRGGSRLRMAAMTLGIRLRPYG